MTDAIQAPQADEFTQAVEVMQKALRRYPQTTAPELIDRYLAPLLEMMREEYLSGFADVQEQVDAVADGGGISDMALLEGAKDTLLLLAGLVDLVFVHNGWIKDNKMVTEAIPANDREAFDGANARTQEWMQAYAELLTQDDGDEEGDAPSATTDANTAPAPAEVPA